MTASEGQREPSILEVLVFAPIDATFSTLADPLTAAQRGRERVESVLRQARALGELTVRFGAAEIRRRTVPETAKSAPASASRPAQRTTPARRTGPDAPNDVISGYDDLSAAQIVPLLNGLSGEERSKVADYERSARSRQTILRRIEQLDAKSA